MDYGGQPTQPTRLLNKPNQIIIYQQFFFSLFNRTAAG
jgi:hypothetical protein